MDTRCVHLFLCLLSFSIRERKLEESSNRLLGHLLHESTQLFIPRIIRTFRGNRNWIPPPRTEQLFSLWIASNWTRGTSRLTSRERGREKQREREGGRGRGRREAVGGTNKFNIGQMERRKVLETMGTGDGKGNVVAFVTRCIRCYPMGGGGRR